MNFIKFLKDQLTLILFWLLSLLVINLVLIVEPKVNLTVSTLAYLDLLSLIVLSIYIIIAYNKKSNWYQSLEIMKGDSTKEITLTKNNEEAYQADVISDIVMDLRQELSELNASKNNQEEFIESWVHDIKVPIAAIQLILEKDNLALVQEKTKIELSSINHLVEQVLYYSRLNNFANDYLIKQCDLESVINTSIRNNMTTFINKNISVEVSAADNTVLTDEKWLEFILNQIISNSLKYTPESGSIKIFAENIRGNVSLTISDSGIGIAPEDLSRVFEKGFTGQNGRMSSSKSTGLGLYLAKKMSDKLGQDLTIDSETNVGTTVTIIFPTLSYFKQFDNK